MTTHWNLPAADIDTAIGPLRPGGDATDRRGAFADAAWSFLVEPGDRVAGALVRRYGAGDALAAVVERRDAATLADDDLSADEITDAFARWEPRLDTAALFRALTTGASVGAVVVRPSDAEWPDGLVDLADHAPRVLWCRGNVEALPRIESTVALVGARASTGYGEHVAMDFAAGLASRDYTVVSGGAYGIDGMAHRATIACGGTTVAVLAGGIDQFYPAGHDELLRRIVETGVVLSEVSPGGAPTRWRFLQRNRLIAASAGVTVVIEAGYRSGSLNTASHARDLDRPIGVVPGPITSGASAGCHRLLRDNPAATLVTTVGDIIELMGDADPSTVGIGTGASAESVGAKRAWDALSDSRTRSVADVAARSGLAIVDTMSALGELEASGRATRTDVGEWVRSNSG